ETDWRGEQNHDPIDLKPANQFPDMTVQIGEEERREVPDRFLRANLAEAAAGEAAADRERKRNPFTADERRDSDDRSDDGAGVWAGKESREKRSGKGQVGGVVVDEQPRDHACCEGDAKARRKNEAFRPIPLFGEENAPEPRKP